MGTNDDRPSRHRCYGNNDGCMYICSVLNVFLSVGSLEGPVVPIEWEYFWL